MPKINPYNSEASSNEVFVPEARIAISAVEGTTPQEAGRRKGPPQALSLGRFHIQISNQQHV